MNLFDNRFMNSEELLLDLDIPELDVAKSIQNLGLAKRVKDSDLEDLNLPKIVGVAHTDDENYSAIARVIYGLPKESKIGLEREYGADREQRKNANFFLERLRTYAESQGHQVINLEPDAVQLSPDVTKLSRLKTQMAKANLLKKVQLLPSYIATSLKAHKSLSEILLRTTTYRSLIMSRAITRRRDWKSTDISIKGMMHAIQVGGILKTPVFTPINAKNDNVHTVFQYARYLFKDYFYKKFPNHIEHDF